MFNIGFGVEGAEKPGEDVPGGDFNTPEDFFNLEIFSLMAPAALIVVGIIARWSPYYYFLANDPLVNGIDWGNGAVYAGITIVMIILSVYLFQRRDLRYNG